MAHPIDHVVVLNLVQTWDSLKKVPNFHDVAGRRIFRKFFELDPRAHSLFFAVGKAKDKELALHARMVVDMLDYVIHLMATSTHLAQMDKELGELGKRHMQYGVHPDQLTIMGKAVVITLDKMLGIGNLTEEDRQNWYTFFELIAGKMAGPMKSEQCQ
jgi:hemoglobin-like flavoprotein